jgi:hypothetical protein
MGSQVFSWVNPKLEVRIAGGGEHKGIFTNEAVRKGEKLVVFGGRIVHAREEVGDYGIQIDEEFVIGAKEMEGTEAEDHFNHSCEPNAGIRGQITLAAMRDIARDEEITFDYAMCLHEVQGVPPYRLECLCGKPNCRKIITDSDWKLPELQKKYDGWFSWYLEEKINKVKRHQITPRVMAP